MSSYHDIPARFVPIEQWPGEPTRRRERSRFRASWSMTLDLLKTELRHLGAKNVLIEIDMPERMIRLDGYPRADARADGPGVILSLESRHGPLRYPCDRFTDWEDNVRAIALSLQALRAVDRYGVTRRGEQYTGWKKLPPAGGSTPTMDVSAAAAFMVAAEGRGGEAEDLIEGPHAREAIERTYRNAAKQLHPDAGGSARDFSTLGEARRALLAFHGNGGHP